MYPLKELKLLWLVTSQMILGDGLLKTALILIARRERAIGPRRERKFQGSWITITVGSMVETIKEYIDRKATEIIEFIEAAKNADAIITFSITDTIAITPGTNISTPTYMISITINESKVKEWISKK